jgi:hypothetical protein
LSSLRSLRLIFEQEIQSSRMGSHIWMEPMVFLLQPRSDLGVLVVSFYLFDRDMVSKTREPALRARPKHRRADIKSRPNPFLLLSPPSPPSLLISFPEGAVSQVVIHGRRHISFCLGNRRSRFREDALKSRRRLLHMPIGIPANPGNVHPAFIRVHPCSSVVPNLFLGLQSPKRFRSCHA